MYNHQEIEKKWQKYWQENNTFQTSNISSKPKYYCLDMFPYPSGAGLHVGHPEGFTANDIVARYKHAKGYNVLHPMGWDAFGLPAENYAIKTGVHPRITTAENIATFKRQIQSLGFSYDWSREIDTTDPKYFQWTQWIFLKLFEAGLAYEQDLPINYCPSCKTGLANEEVLNDFSCERCGTQVEKKKIRQWVLAITKYAERLLADVDDLDWPEGIKDMQRNWIGKSEGCEFEMKCVTTGTGTSVPVPSIRVYTTRVDTVFGMTYAVIAPDHPDVHNFIETDHSDECFAYIKKATQQSDQDRTADDKEKTGVFTGSYVINPYNDEKVPLWIADYVLGNYGTGAVMAVPAHDERDFAFAKKYGLEIRQSVAKNNIYTGVSAERNGVETLNREVVDVILENDKGEFFVIEENNPKDYHFIGGGIENGDTELETVHKEVIEESGYNDIEIIGPIGGTFFYSQGFRHTKQKNQRTCGRFFHAKLKSDSRVKSEIDDGHHNGKWVKKQDISNLITWEVHLSAWNIFYNGLKATTEYGKLVNSGKYDGLSSQEAKEVFMKLAEEQGFGTRKVNYKLRDWLFSRQRYWGEPIPLIHISTEDLEKLPTSASQDAWIKNGDILMVGEKEFSKIYDGIYGKIVCDYNLPLELPQVEAYEPAGDGQSPLAKVPDFVHVELAKNLHGKRETNTMPQWGGSCWYYLRFMDPKNPDALVGSEAEKYWGSVDSYVGGAEHAVLHLLYARFWHKFLYDIGVVSTSEPFYRLRNQGMILGMSYKNTQGKLIASDMVEEVSTPNGTGTQYISRETGEELQKIPAKMSKSLKNVVNPDEIVELHGADTLRLYEMYMGDFADSKPWDTKAIIGCRRFLDKVHILYIDSKEKYAQTDEEAMRMLHKTIKKVTEDIENYKFNTAIAQMMICLNTGIPQDIAFKNEWKEIFLKLLHPFAPHIAEECWESMSVSKNTYLKAYYATGNDGKIKRAQSVLDTLRSSMTLEKIPELIEVEETALTARECALQKLEAYKGKGYKVPVICSDTSVHFDNQDFEPTKVRRAAIEASGKSEAELTKMQIAELMIAFYKNIAKKAGGSIDFYYTDAFAVLLPDGTVQTNEYKREYILTDESKGDIYPDAPMRSLYISQVTGKRAHETTMQDYIKEFSCQAEAFSEIFGFGKNSIFFTDWPSYDEALTVESEVTIGVQVLGKLRGEIQISVDEDKGSVLTKAKTNPDVMKWLEGKQIVKEIYVPGKIVNIVVK